MDGKTKSRKKKIILMLIPVIIIAFELYSHYIFRTWNPVKAFETWKSVAVDGEEVYQIKKAYYCSGCMDKHWQGFLFVSYDISEEQAMNEIGYYDIGHKYKEYKSEKEYTEYCTSEYGEHTIVYRKRPYLGGYFLEYHVVGEL